MTFPWGHGTDGRDYGVQYLMRSFGLMPDGEPSLASDMISSPQGAFVQHGPLLWVMRCPRRKSRHHVARFSHGDFPDRQVAFFAPPPTAAANAFKSICPR